MSFRTFADASKQIQASLQKHLEKVPSGPDLSDDSEDETHAGSESDEAILDRVFRGYGLDQRSIESIGSRTKEALLDSLKRGAGPTSCLICISSIKKSDAIWCCQVCYCSFHLNCIQRWGRDNIFQQKSEHENQSVSVVHGRDQSKPVFKWGCPKCRHTYPEEKIPSRYQCFCGKEDDPQFDPWLVPHSCGNPCSKDLQPECGHRCLILCHPGPCPPCPKMLLSDCCCGQSAPAQRRCYEKIWSCRKPCNKKLNCGQHYCPIPCHPGDCPPCSKKSFQLCLCQRNKKECDCAEPQWQCKESCGKPLGCGHHLCDLVCHKGSCPPCPLSQLRFCPCGKSRHQLPCTVATPTCFDTCGKLLACGTHVCSERCHRGTCGSCLEMVVKRCRCGTKQKEVLCSKDYICDVKCKNMKDCRKHACNKKCCDGTNCLPCEQQCGKTLACKNHKCASRCHQGACYPCTMTKEVTCSCGTSRILVPCGMERSARPPKCKMKCQKPTECHHPARLPHGCHFGDCPPCRQQCDKVLKCSHLCPAPCHDRVLVRMEDPSKTKAATPWEETSPQMEYRALPCPDCQYPVPVTCLGNHDTSQWPCSVAKVGPCGRPCGRNLPCTNHICERDCHKVKNAPNEVDAGSNCRKCEIECQKKRPDGCSHACLKPCHPGLCEQCSVPIRIRCHCGIAQLYVQCGQWITSSDSDKQEMACCKDQCPKLLSCGHRCYLMCHNGDCGSPSQCKKKMKLFCPCKRKKQESACSKSNGQKIDCDEECKALKLKASEEEAKEAERRREEENRLQREEAERFNKKLDGKRKRRNRRTTSENVEVGFVEKWRKLIAATLVVAVLAGLWYQFKPASVSD